MCREVGLHFVDLVNVCTDSASPMTGKCEGFIAEIKRENYQNQTLVSLHQENLYDKSTTLSGMICIVKYINSNVTWHLQFRNLLSRKTRLFSVYLLYHSKMC